MRSGFFKTSVSTEDGRDQVTGFPMTGELLGLDAIGDAAHNCDAVALEDSQVCVTPYGRLEELARQFTGLQRQFHRVMSILDVRQREVRIVDPAALRRLVAGDAG